jgi:hypothetical protein
MKIKIDNTFHWITLVVSVGLGAFVKVFRLGFNDANHSDIVNVLLGSSPSFFYTVGVCIIPLIFDTKKKVLSMIFLAIGSLTYELEQNWTERTFDSYDIIAIVLGCLIPLLVYKFQKEQHEV